MQPWIYQNQPLESAPDAFGFVYLITNLTTQQKYIGKKQFHSRTLSRKTKTKKRRKRTVKESDWQKYFGSCDELLEDVSFLGLDNFRREILTLCQTKGELTYGEVEAQIKRDVLTSRLVSGEYEYYNRCIASRWYRR